MKKLAEKAENFMSTIEEKFTNEFKNFEESPIKSTIKWVIIYQIVKYLYNKFIK
jgi:hypothetical protein